MNTDYVKAILYAYPALGEIGEAVGASADNKALLSYKNPRAAEEVAVEILKEIAARHALEELCALVDRMLEMCSAEERYLLEYKYFRRKRVLEGEFGNFTLGCSERSYFRKQNRLFKKAAEYFFRNGWTQEKFLRETNGLFARVLGALGRDRECAVRGQRKRGRLAYSSP